MDITVQTGRNPRLKIKFLLKMAPRIYLQALFIGIVAFIVYVCNGTFVFPSGDTAPNSLLPFSLLLHHDFFIGRYFTEAHLNPKNFYYLLPSHGDYVDGQPPGTAFTAVPIYAMYVLLGGTPSLGAAVLMGKLGASVISATSVSLTYVLLRKLAIRWSVSVVFTILYGIGSETFAISSQGLWRHGPDELWVLIFLLSIVQILKNPQQSVIASQCAGFAMGMLILIRPQNILLFAPFALLAVRKEYLKPIFLSLPLVFVSLAGFERYNMFIHTMQTGSSAGGVTPSGSSSVGLVGSAVVSILGRVKGLTGSFLGGLLGNTISPSRGLFIYMPWTIFSFFTVFKIRTLSQWRGLVVLSTITVIVYILVFSKLSYWVGGASFGGRYMTEILPFLTLLAAVYFEYALVRHRSTPRWRSLLRSFAVLTFGIWSIGVQFLGTDVPSGNGWDSAAATVGFHSNVWSLRDAEIPYHVRALIASQRPQQIVEHPSVKFGAFSIIGVIPNANNGIPLQPSQQYYGTLTVSNTGTEVWPAYAANNGVGFVQLIYMVYRDGKRFSFPLPYGQITTLLHSVTPGQSETFYFYMTTPPQPGRYTYSFTLAQYGYKHFGKGLGGENTLDISITVL